MKLLNLTKAGDYKVWEEGLKDLSDRELHYGLLKSRNFTGFFNLGEFRVMCIMKPEDLGMPKFEKAYLEAAKNCHRADRHRWSHPAVYKALMGTSIFVMRREPEKRSKAAFKRHYELITRMVMNGESINVNIPQALPESVEIACTVEENLFGVEALKAVMGD